MLMIISSELTIIQALALITSTGSGSRRLSRTKETEEEESAI